MLVADMPDLKPIAGSLGELVAGATVREPMKTSDSLSGARFERLVIDGAPFILKHLHVDDDWIQRASGDLTCRPVLVWRSGLLDRVRHIIDDAVVGCATGLGRNGWGAALLLHDVGELLVPEGHGTLDTAAHLRFIDHMAEMHAAFWGFTDEYGFVTEGSRYSMLTPRMAAIEAALHAEPDPVPRMMPSGWRNFTDEAPRAARIVLPLLENPFPLADALARTPQTFVHGDWKAGNLGSHPDGRTILLDWAFPGQTGGCVDLAWYVAVNCERLPHSKEATIDAYRSGLERRGFDTAPWWDEQLSLAMIGILVHMGWSKTGDELAWWDDRIESWARWL